MSTRETWIGACRVRLVAVTEVLAATTRLIQTDPSALLAPDPDPPPDSRSAAALRQRLARLEEEVKNPRLCVGLPLFRSP